MIQHYGTVDQSDLHLTSASAAIHELVKLDHLQGAHPNTSWPAFAWRLKRLAKSFASQNSWVETAYRQNGTHLLPKNGRIVHVGKNPGQQPTNPSGQVTRT